jgi:hypothetical protein
MVGVIRIIASSFLERIQGKTHFSLQLCKLCDFFTNTGRCLSPLFKCFRITRDSESLYVWLGKSYIRPARQSQNLFKWWADTCLFFIERKKLTETLVYLDTITITPRVLARCSNNPICVSSASYHSTIHWDVIHLPSSTGTLFWSAFISCWVPQTSALCTMDVHHLKFTHSHSSPTLCLEIAS